MDKTWLATTITRSLIVALIIGFAAGWLLCAWATVPSEDDRRIATEFEAVAKRQAKYLGRENCMIVFDYNSRCPYCIDANGRKVRFWGNDEEIE